MIRLIELEKIIMNSLEWIKQEVNTRHYHKYNVTYNDVVSIYHRDLQKPFSPNPNSMLDYKSQHMIHALRATGKFYNMYYK